MRQGLVIYNRDHHHGGWDASGHGLRSMIALNRNELDFYTREPVSLIPDDRRVYYRYMIGDSVIFESIFDLHHLETAIQTHSGQCVHPLTKQPYSPAFLAYVHLRSAWHRYQQTVSVSLWALETTRLSTLATRTTACCAGALGCLIGLPAVTCVCLLWAAMPWLVMLSSALALARILSAVASFLSCTTPVMTELELMAHVVPSLETEASRRNFARLTLAAARGQTP